MRPPSESEQSTIASALSVLGACGLERYSLPIAERLADGRLLVADLETGEPGFPRWCDAVYHHARDLVLVNENSLRYLPPRALASVILDEAAHIVHNTHSHAIYRERDRDLRLAWEAAAGRPWSSVGPEEQEYEPYLKRGYWWVQTSGSAARAGEH